MSPALEKTLDDMLELPEGWNSYRAKRVDVLAVLNARKIVTWGTEVKLPEPAAVPLATGGVQLEWHVGGVDMEIECRADGKVRVLMVAPADPEITDDDDLFESFDIYPDHDTLMLKLFLGTAGIAMRMGQRVPA